MRWWNLERQQKKKRTRNAIFYSDEKWLWASTPPPMHYPWSLAAVSCDEKVHSFSLFLVSLPPRKNQIVPRTKVVKHFSNDLCYHWRLARRLHEIPLRSHTMRKQTCTGVDLIMALARFFFALSSSSWSYGALLWIIGPRLRLSQMKHHQLALFVLGSFRSRRKGFER